MESGEDGAGKHTDHLEVNMAGDAGLHWEPSSKVPAAEVQGRADDEIWDLTHNLGADEGYPMVFFRLLGQISILFFSFVLAQILTFFSRVSNRSRLCRKNGCIWLMQPGATNRKLKTAKTRSWRSKELSPMFQKVKPLKRAAKMCRLILFQT
jgi:hypothetical protein